MKRVGGQSMVEMALLLPFLLMLIFGIIDLGWYVYGYATIYQAVRNGSEVAAQLPPLRETLADPVRQGEDPCYKTIVAEVQDDAALFQDLSSSVVVRYPSQDPELPQPREIGNPIEVSVTYTLTPLTPLFQFVMMGNNGFFSVSAEARRSIEALGTTPPSPQYPNGSICQ